MKNILVVFNSSSGNKKADSTIKTIYKKFKKANLKFKFAYVKTLPFLKNTDLYDTVIAVGGDGTINSVLSLVINTNKSLGIIPTGTANLLAANLSIPNNVSNALKIIFNKKTAKIDAAKAGEKYFVLRLGFGYDADILNNTTQYSKEKLGYFAYFLQGIIKIFSQKNITYKIKLDDERMFVSAGNIIIANAGNMFKNIFTIAPNGTLDDGKLDVFIRRTKNFTDFVEVFLRIILKKYCSSSKIIYKQASKIVVKSRNKKLHIDGENSFCEETLVIEVVPSSIKIFVP